MKRKGLLVEIKGSKGILLTRDGDFVLVRVPEGAHSLGSEILADEWSGFMARGRPAVWAAVAVLLLALVFPAWNGWMAGNQPVMAYVSVDVNPSVELGVGADGKVWRGRPLNQEGDHLLSTVRYVGQSLPKVLADLTQAALDQGYIGIDDEGVAPDAILVVAVPAKADQPLPVGVQEALRQGEHSIRQEFQSRHVAAQIQFIQHDRYALHEEAEAMQLSMGRYLLLLEARRELESPDMSGGNPADPSQQTEEPMTEPDDVQVVVHEETPAAADDTESDPSLFGSNPSQTSAAETINAEQPIASVEHRSDSNNGRRDVPDVPKADEKPRQKNQDDEKDQHGGKGKSPDSNKEGANRSRSNNDRDDRNDRRQDDKDRDDDDRDGNDRDYRDIDVIDIRQGKLKDLLREYGLEIEQLLERMKDEYDRANDGPGTHSQRNSKQNHGNR